MRESGDLSQGLTLTHKKVNLFKMQRIMVSHLRSLKVKSKH